ncbi:hypothetical protein VTO42DRAFT_5915 [Malbranchea cinnamomea]
MARGEDSQSKMDMDVEAKVADSDSGTPNELSHLSEEQLAKLDRRLVLKLDLILVPIVGMFYLLAFLDRANIGNARVAGLQTDLAITDHQYQTAITVTYVPYIVAELPSNLVLKKIGPRILLPGLCFTWGVVTTLQSLVNNYSGLLACRFFLGLFEGGLLPGIVLYLSGFYRPAELQIRIALFFATSALSGAFSGLLAAAIQNMEGVGNMRGWKWIFCLEGIFTACFGVFAAFFLPNNPRQVPTFKPEEIARCIDRLHVQAQFPDTERVTLKKVCSILKDVHIWILACISFCSGACLFGLAYFTPSIVQTLGYSTTKTQLLTVPPFVIGWIVSMIAAYLSDHYKQRGIAGIATTLLALIGGAMMYRGRSFAMRYTALCFLITGVYATAPSLISWTPNNTAGYVRRATATAFIFVFTNTGGIVSTWIYPKNQAPYYLFAAKFNLSLIVFTIFFFALNIAWLWRMNKRKEEKRDEILGDYKSLSLAEQFEKLGDSHPDFKYIY